MVANKTNLKIKCLRLDNGGEFMSKEFRDFCEEHGTKIQFSVAMTPQQNEVIERKKKIVHEWPEPC
jgi:transposase InsO family protein